MNDLLAGRDAASAVARPEVAEAMPFRRDDDTPFPTAGAALLLLLLGLAAWAWWTASRRGPQPASMGARAVRFWKAPRGETRSARVVGSTRLGPGAALHVVEWHGTELLVAINGSSEPVVLGRQTIGRASNRGDEP